MDSHHVIDAAKTAPAWVAIGVSHISSDLTLSGVASIVAIVYSVIQTYISIKRYRAGK
jgi:hypothetical protein